MIALIALLLPYPDCHSGTGTDTALDIDSGTHHDIKSEHNVPETCGIMLTGIQIVSESFHIETDTVIFNDDRYILTVINSPYRQRTASFTSFIDAVSYRILNDRLDT